MFRQFPLWRPSWLASPLPGFGVRLAIFAAISAAAPAGPAQAALTSVGPFPYTSAADSPFASDPRYVTYIEDFEDGVLNIPGVVEIPLPPGAGMPDPPPGGVDPIPGIVLPPGLNTDSVDGDDGAIDGSGSGGRSLESVRHASLLDGRIYSVLRFRLEPNAAGQYPRAFGFVWTDGEPDSSVELFIGEVGVFVREIVGWYPLQVGDPASDGGTAEDRFFGITSDAGITSVNIGSYYYDEGVTRRTSFEVDHLQIAYLVPEPSAAALLVVGAAGFSLCRRRRSKFGLARMP